MDSTLKQTSSLNRIASVDVSRLDKVNAIPNKTTDNALSDGLSPEDQAYLNTLIDDDLSEDEILAPSAWSPMAQSPSIMNKRMRKLKQPYTITLSLEDISYIRPSWGISKGVKTIEILKHKKQQKQETERRVQEVKVDKSDKPSERIYHYCLLILTVAVLALIIPPYVIDGQRKAKRVQENRMKVISKQRIADIYKPSGDALDSIQRIEFGRGIPTDLKHDECSCDIYEAETMKYDENSREGNSSCLTSLDWPFRANLRIYVERPTNMETICYRFLWQSYDSLSTPLIDCFLSGDEQWYGLGDTLEPVWPINGYRADWTPLVTNLSSKFPSQQHGDMDDILMQKIQLGSWVNFTLLSTSGIIVDDVKTDFSLSIKVSLDFKSGLKKICLAASCSDTCNRIWTRDSHLKQFRRRNNYLEYKVCSASSSKVHISNKMQLAMREQMREMDHRKQVKVSADYTQLSDMSASEHKTDKLRLDQVEPVPAPSATAMTGLYKLPAGIGLIERTIFTTSSEFMPVLDGQILRQHVDRIIKLGLKTSSIILIDVRWESYIGSLKLNTMLFPKAKLLFEILHNKGFKIVLQIKPFMDSATSATLTNQLFSEKKLYGASYGTDLGPKSFENWQGVKTDTVLRRKSLFRYEEEPIQLEFNSSTHPYLFRCKESAMGQCTLIDLSREQTREWMIGTIKKSPLLMQEVDAISIGGVHPNMFNWDDHYRSGVSDFVKRLYYDEGVFVIPQWTGDLGYIQMAPRSFTWSGLRSLLGSVLNLGAMGHSLIHPGSVWGDIGSAPGSARVVNPKPIYGEAQLNEKSDEELATRWLQLSVFLPVLQFNNLDPIFQFNLLDILQSLVKIRKSFIVPEIKKHLPFTPLIDGSRPQLDDERLPVIRPVWLNQDRGEVIVPEEFMVGPDILVAPILSEGVRQREIYLPPGYWHDELRQAKIRGGKWLRNYPVELNEIAWFTRARRVDHCKEYAQQGGMWDKVELSDDQVGMHCFLRSKYE